MSAISSDRLTLFMDATKLRPAHWPQPLEIKSGSGNDKSRPYYAIVAGIEECGKKLGTIESNYRKSLNETLAKLVEIGLELAENDAAWDSFRTEKRWGDKPLSKHAQRDAVTHVLKWACDLSRDGSKKASFYSRAVKRLLGKGVKPKDMPMAIERGGGLRKLAAATKPKSEKKPIPIADKPEVIRSKPVLEQPNPVRVKQDTSRRRPRPLDDAVSAFVTLKLNEHFHAWSRMKQDTRFTLTCTLDQMAGDSAQITVESLQIL